MQPETILVCIQMHINAPQPIWLILDVETRTAVNVQEVWAHKNTEAIHTNF